MLPPEGRGDDLATAQEAVTDLFVLLTESGGLSGDDAVPTARLVRSALHGLVSLESIEALTQPHDRDLSFERLVDAAGFAVARAEATGLPIEVADRGAGEPAQAESSGSGRSIVSKVDRALVSIRPTLFAYQFLYELEPTRT